MYGIYRNEGELIAFQYHNDMVSSGWLEVKVEFGRTGKDIHASSPTEGSIVGICRHGTGASGTIFSCKDITCKPSVRSEVEKQVKDYMSCCGIDMRSVLKETHSFKIGCGTPGSGNPEYILAFEGIPDKGEVRYSIMTCNQQVLTSGLWHKDIKRRGDLASAAIMILEKYLTVNQQRANIMRMYYETHGR